MNYFIIFGLLISGVYAQSWLAFPFAQQQEQYLFTPEKMANKNQIWGCSPVGKKNSPEIFPEAIVNRGEELCVSWISNGKSLDPQRGYVSIYLTNNQTDLQANLFQNPLIQNVDFNNFEGIKVQIPEDFPIGPAILQWRWFYCGENEMYVSCADIEISESEGTKYGIPESYSGYTFGNCRENATAFMVNNNGQEFCPYELDNPDYYWTVNDISISNEEQQCIVDINMDIGNPYVGAIDVNDITYGSSCDAGTTATSSESACSIQISLDFINREYNQVNLTNLVYNTDCGTQNISNIPEGYCETDSDCPENSYCKTFQERHSNGYYACQ